jgi:hypothetical protein
MKLLTRVAATAVIALLAVGGPALVLGASPSEPAGPVASVPGQWTAAAPMIEERAVHTATRLLDGRVLVTGGPPTDACALPPSAELYDPGSGT